MRLSRSCRILAPLGSEQVVLSLVLINTVLMPLVLMATRDAVLINIRSASMLLT